MRKVSYTVMVLCLVFSRFAMAHSVGADCYASDDGKWLVVEVWTGRDEAPKSASITVRRPDGTLLIKGKADGEGRFVFAPEAAVRYEIYADCGLGHAKRFTVRAEELAKLRGFDGGTTTEAPEASRTIQRTRRPRAEAAFDERKVDMPPRARPEVANTMSDGDVAVRTFVGLAFIASLVALLLGVTAHKRLARIERKLKRKSRDQTVLDQTIQ